MGSDQSFLAGNCLQCLIKVNLQRDALPRPQASTLPYRLCEEQESRTLERLPVCDAALRRFCHPDLVDWTLLSSLQQTWITTSNGCYGRRLQKSTVYSTQTTLVLIKHNIQENHFSENIPQKIIWSLGKGNWGKRLSSRKSLWRGGKFELRGQMLSRWPEWISWPPGNIHLLW